MKLKHLLVAIAVMAAPFANVGGAGCAMAQLIKPKAKKAKTTAVADDSKYLMKGAVPVVDGQVRFSETVAAPGQTKEALFATLKDAVQKQIIEGPDHLEKARLTEVNAAEGLIVASVEEYLYFKRKAWSMDRVRFTYQLILTAKDGSYSVEMRRLQYQYDDVPNAEVLYAEDWITDEEALADGGKKLAKKAGKFRRGTIDRKDAIFATLRNAKQN